MFPGQKGESCGQCPPVFPGVKGEPGSAGFDGIPGNAGFPGSPGGFGVKGRPGLPGLDGTKGGIVSNELIRKNSSQTAEILLAFNCHTLIQLCKFKFN